MLHNLLSTMSTSETPLPSPPSPPKYLKEDEVTQECKDLMSSLPKQRGWIVPQIYNYQGFWHTPRQLQGVLAFQTHFKAQNNDILLITTPKSGTTWLKALTFAVVNRLHHHPKNKDHPLLTCNPHFIVPFLELKVYLETKSPVLTSLTSPRLFATHLPLVSLPQNVQNSPCCKLVYLCRNAKDTFISMWQFTNKLRANDLGSNSIEQVLDLFCEGVSLYGPFWDHVKGYYEESKRQPNKILFLKYEEMKEDPSLHLRRLAEFLGFPFSLGEEKEGVVDSIIELCSFGNLSNLEVNKAGKLSSGEAHQVFFRRGEVGDWKNHLTPAMVDRLDKMSEEKLHGCGLKL